ncbi:helix-turn-helix transcriptional regulator [Rhizobium sp. YTUHZ045]|uniref:S24 family peptidase n=1 Tax=Rhizobium sp. YTUHZ045 TaxID=2962888 RepID=UPI003DA94611
MRDPQHDVKQWLATKLEERGEKAAFGKAIGMTADKVTRSIELESSDPKKRRKLDLKEIEAAARYFGELPPGFEGMKEKWLGADFVISVGDQRHIIGQAKTSRAQKPEPNASFPPRYQQFPDDVSIPLRGQISAGPNGRFIMNGQDIARVFCPPGLDGVEGAYAVQVQGSSGEPRFFNGETAWVNPHAKVRQGDDVIVQVLGDNDGDEVYSYIKRYVSQSKDTLRLYQYNPGEGETHELEFPADRVFSIHKVVFHAML